MEKAHSVFDVADWFLAREEISPKRLQKLVYYVQAWSYTLLDAPMMVEGEDKNPVRFEAWAHGPANPELHKMYRDYRWKGIPRKEDNSTEFSKAELDLLGSIWETYSDYSPNEIENLTLDELPWLNARKRAGAYGCDCSSELITPEDMKNYYSTIYIGDDFEEKEDNKGD